MKNYENYEYLKCETSGFGQNSKLGLITIILNEKINILCFNTAYLPYFRKKTRFKKLYTIQQNVIDEAKCRTQIKYANSNFLNYSYHICGGMDTQVYGTCFVRF